jgi:1-acyl-sn-glycerol-3-phosphate acyltransferase
MIPVTRSGNDVGALKTTLKNLDEGRSIGIFPQGTRHPGKDPRDTKLRGGLGMIQAHSGASILPIYIETKDNKVKFFRRITVILGEVITPEEIGKEGKGKVEYDRISNLVFDRICTLGEEYKKSLEAKK